MTDTQLPTYDKNDPGTYLRAALAVLDQNAVRSTKQPALIMIDQARAWIQTALSLLPTPAAAPQPPKVPALRIGAEVRVKNSAGEHGGRRGVIVAKGDGNTWEVMEYGFPSITVPFSADELTVLE